MTKLPSWAYVISNDVDGAVGRGAGSVGVGLHGEPGVPLVCVGDDGGQADGELLVERTGCFDGELVFSVHAPSGCEPAEDVVGVLDEVLVDVEWLGRRALRQVEVSRQSPRPGGTGGFSAGESAPQHQEVDDDVGARRCRECPLRKAKCADEISDGRHLSPSRWVAGVERVARGERDDEATGANEMEALDEEVVVEGVAAAVVARVVRGDLCEGHVADDEVERPVVGTEVLEAFGVDGRSSAVEVSGDLGGGRVQLDADQIGTVGSEADEVARPAPWFEDPTVAVEAELLDGRPHRGDDRGRGVVRVQRGAPSLGPSLVVAEERAELGSGVGVTIVVVVEDLGHRTPTRPSSEGLLLGGCRPSVLGSAGGEDAEGRQVGLELGPLSRRGEVGLACGSKRWRALRRRPVVYEVWMVSLIRARSRK